VLHYAQTVFDGLKAYRDTNGRVTLFRHGMNMRRLNSSAARVALPAFSPDALGELITELVRVEKEWIPQAPGHSLYIRPTMSACPRPARRAR
jgi:branched-chain amino acid aminotransferase